MLRKKEFIDAVVSRSGIKRRDAKAVIEAALVVIGEAVADGRGTNLPGLGKLKITKRKRVANAHVSTVRIRQPHKVQSAETPG